MAVVGLRGGSAALLPGERGAGRARAPSRRDPSRRPSIARACARARRSVHACWSPTRCPRHRRWTPDEVARAAARGGATGRRGASAFGKARTPFLLSALAELTDGRSLEANLALLEDNARVAAEIAVGASLPAGRASGDRRDRRAPPASHRAVGRAPRGRSDSSPSTFVLAFVRDDVIAAPGMGELAEQHGARRHAGVPMIATFLWLGGVLRRRSRSGRYVRRRSRRWRSAGYLVTASGRRDARVPHRCARHSRRRGTASCTWRASRGDRRHADRRGAVCCGRPEVAGRGGRCARRSSCSSSRPWSASPAASSEGWAKVVYVIGITLPAAVVPWCLRRAGRRRRRPPWAALT